MQRLKTACRAASCLLCVKQLLMVLCVLWLRVSGRERVGWGGNGDKFTGVSCPGVVPPSGSCNLVREPREHPGDRAGPWGWEGSDVGNVGPKAGV